MLDELGRDSRKTPATLAAKGVESLYTSIAAVEPTSDAPAHFRILANPQASVEIDGKPRGAAPLADLVVSPGTHRVRLDCAPLGEAVSQNVRVDPGEGVTISGDFTGAHGRILVRRAGAGASP